MGAPQTEKDTVAVIGAGVVGCAVALALAKEGRRVLLLDPAEPGVAGASFGNVGHIAAELVEPLPSTALLFGFWRELFAFNGPLDIPLRRLPGFLPWAARFAAAAFRQAGNTRHLAPLVKPASAAFERLLREIGRLDLLRRNGHYQFWLSAAGREHANAEARKMAHLGIATAEVAPDVLNSVAAAAGSKTIAGLKFPDSGHVLDPLSICQVIAEAAVRRGATLRRAGVRALQPRGGEIAVITDTDTLVVSTAVVCAGVWSAPLLAPFGLRAPLEAGRGYHVELPNHPAHVDAPMIYMDQRILVTPMASRLRASTYMEFSGMHAAPDPRKPARLRRKLKGLGYRCDEDGPSWVGPRPILPDYLPGIGRAPGPCKLFYAVGHQHIGLTLAPVTGDLISDLVAERTPRHDIAAFDLRRF